ncbi:MAG: DUF5050 domain-containing protein [Clostridiales bacterium]|nr:DUF5050 domain-containing protein [Clostridiales bacterium]
MKKKLLKVVFTAFAACCLAFPIAACGDDPNPTPAPPSGTEQPNDPKPNDPKPNEPTKQQITGVTFADKTVTYNGAAQTVEVSGTLPEGVSVSYTDNSGTDAGTYTAKAVLSGEGYETLNLTATLKIEKATFTGLTLEDVTVEYDGNAHAVEVSGTLPEGTSVTYNSNTATAVGTYQVTATVKNANYNDLTLSATLKINGKPITGVTFEDKTVTYNGNAHAVEVAGTLPAGVSVSYTDNSKTNAGTYTAQAALSGEGYEPLTLTATLKIEKADFAGITMDNLTVAYDGKPHTVEIAGALPEGTTVTYYCEEDDAITNTATATGTYNISAVLRNANYNDFMITAILKITASEKERHIAYYDGKLYFANALDDDKLYSFNFGMEIKKVSSDTPSYFTVMGDNLYFRSKALTSSLKAIQNSKMESVFAANAEYLCTNGTNLYYVKNGLTNAKSGIYQLSLDGDEPVETLLSEGKAKYMVYAKGSLFFADGTNDDKLSAISVSSGNGIRHVVVDEKIKALTTDGDYLYYTVNHLLGDYIANYRIADATKRKLTSDAGNNLTVVDGKLYYLNVDWLTSTLYGKGIYCVDARPAVDSNSPGEKIIGEEGESYSSLTATGNGQSRSGLLAYYRVSDQMLCTYYIAGGTGSEVLEGFVAPETTPLSTGSKTAVYNKSVYFLNLYNDKALYVYDTVTGTTSRVTANKVSDFAIFGDTLYFNQVSYGVNNDLYRLDLRVGGEPELVSKNDCIDLATDGENLFYVEQNAAGARTAIHIVKADGTDEIMYSKGAEHLTYYKG